MARANPAEVGDVIDIHVGSRVRLRRKLLGLSQSVLAERLGLTFQQVQKYERGANRVSASRLHDLATVLEVPVSFFYDDMPPELAARGYQPGGGANAAPVAPGAMGDTETSELTAAYHMIKDDRVRKKFRDLIKTAAGEMSHEVEAEDEGEAVVVEAKPVEPKAVEAKPVEAGPEDTAPRAEVKTTRSGHVKWWK